MNLGRYFTHKGILVSGFYGKSPCTTQEASELTTSKYYNNIQYLIHDSDIVFITTPDNLISTIDEQLAQFDLTNKSVCHTSGSLPSTLLSHSKQSGAFVYSIHPIFAFSNKSVSLTALEAVNFSLEGNDLCDTQVIPVLALMKQLGNPYFIRSIEDAAAYHLANVFVSNLTLSLLDIGISYLTGMGLDENQAISALFPLIEGNLQSIAQKGFAQSLTGPVARGDSITVEKHLSVLKEKDEELYKLLSLHLLDIVACRETKLENRQSALTALLGQSENHLKIYKKLGGTKN